MVDPIGTCQALDLLTQDQLEQLFDESNGYLAKVDEIFDTVQNTELEENKNHKVSVSLSSSSSVGQHASDSKEDKKKAKQNQKHRRRSSIITDKKCLILDVDNTLIYVRHFMDEMRVGDEVKLGETNAIVIKITYRLDLEFSENPGTMSSYDHILQSKDDSIPQRGEWFPDELSKVAIIHQSDPIGCVIKLSTDQSNDQSEESDEANEKKEITISFLQNSDELSQLEPMMNRENYINVTFMYGGYLVRIRPDLGQFLSLCNSKYDVILFTAADGSVYEGLLKQVHNILKQQLIESSNNNSIDFHVPSKLWQNVYFRSDCDEKLDEYGLPYRHKNLAKLGRELSTIVMVDDNPLSYRGFEPNSVRVAGFWGLSNPKDNELMQTLFPTLWTIAHHKDVRYHLSGLEQPPPQEKEEEEENDGNDDSEVDILTRQRRHSRHASQKFLKHLKEAIVAENESDDESFEHDTIKNGNENGNDDDDSSVINDTNDDDDTDDTNDNGSLDSISGDGNDEKINNNELDNIFNDKNNGNSIHNRQASQNTESGIGANGALIFDNYDEDVLFHDAYESPKANAIVPNNMFEKRPSIELDDIEQNDARRTVPNSPADDDEDENEDDNGHGLSIDDDDDDDNDNEENKNNNDYKVYSPPIDKNISGSIESESANKKVDSNLLNDSNKSTITGFIDIEMARKTGSRPSRTPTPISDADAEILIMKTSGCSCFGWFGKSKSNNDKNVGLTQQELR